MCDLFAECAKQCIDRRSKNKLQPFDVLAVLISHVLPCVPALMPLAESVGLLLHAAGLLSNQRQNFEQALATMEALPDWPAAAPPVGSALLNSLCDFHGDTDVHHEHVSIALRLAQEKHCPIAVKAALVDQAKCAPTQGEEGEYFVKSAAMVHLAYQMADRDISEALRSAALDAALPLYSTRG